MDWVMVAGVATVATALFTGYAILQRSLERPRPRWRFERGSAAFRADDQGGSWTEVTATNVGDGVAYDVSFKALDGRDVRITMESRRASAKSGEAVHVAVKIDVRVPTENDEYGNAIDVDITTADQIGPARVRLGWRQPPHRWVKRGRTVRVERLAAG